MTYGAPYKTDQEREDYPEDMFDALLDIAVNAGFSPADECEGQLEWIALRYEGYLTLPDDAGFLCFNTAEEQIWLHVMSSHGVQLAHATFTFNHTGLAMFGAALKGMP